MTAQDFGPQLQAESAQGGAAVNPEKRTPQQPEPAPAHAWLPESAPVHPILPSLRLPVGGLGIRPFTNLAPLTPGTLSPISSLPGQPEYAHSPDDLPKPGQIGQKQPLSDTARAHASPGDLPTPQGSQAEGSSSEEARGTTAQLAQQITSPHQLVELRQEHAQQLSELQRQHFQQLQALKDEQLRQLLQAQRRLEKLQERPDDREGSNAASDSAYLPLTNGVKVAVGQIQARSPQPKQTMYYPRYPASDITVPLRPVPESISRPMLPHITDDAPPQGSGSETSWEAQWRTARHIQLSALTTAITTPYTSFRGEPRPPEAAPNGALGGGGAGASPPSLPAIVAPNASAPVSALVSTPIMTGPAPAVHSAPMMATAQAFAPASASVPPQLPPLRALGERSPKRDPSLAAATKAAPPPPAQTTGAAPQAAARERAYACHICSKAFTLKTHLDAHLRRHAGERPHKCAQCGKRFIEKGGLVKHERIHSGERPFKCTECSAAFAENSNLKRHLRTHTTHRPFRCNECPAAYAQRNDLLNHQQIHSGEQKQFACDKCSASFERKAHLNRHFNLIHRSVNQDGKPLAVVSVHPEGSASGPTVSSGQDL